MLPKPWKMPDDIFQEFINTESEHDPDIDILIEERDQIDEIIEYKLELAHKAANKWWNKVVRMMKMDGYIMNPKRIAGLNFNRDRKQIEFLDGYDIFCHQIQDLPIEEQKSLLNGCGKFFKREKPSDIQIDQIVDDLITKTIKNG